MQRNTGRGPVAPAGRTMCSGIVEPSAWMVVSDSSIPDRSTGTEAWACVSTARASRGGKVSSGGPPDAFSLCKKALTPLDRRGSTATSNGCSRSTWVGLLMTPPFLSWLVAPGRPARACAGLWLPETHEYFVLRTLRLQISCQRLGAPHDGHSGPPHAVRGRPAGCTASLLHSEEA